MNPLVNAAVQVLTISFEGFRVIDQEYGPVLLLFTSLSLCLIGFFVISNAREDVYLGCMPVNKREIEERLPSGLT
jgi:hypothetical protein